MLRLVEPSLIERGDDWCPVSMSGVRSWPHSLLLRRASGATCVIGLAKTGVTDGGEYGDAKPPGTQCAGV